MNGETNHKPPSGLYIHIPFCKSKCDYCDFTSFAGLDHLQIEYFEALEKELELQSLVHGKLTFDTVFLGGGTPTQSGSARLVKILKAVWEHFDVADGAELSVEANPDTASLEALRELEGAGINRFSFGIQSAVASELRFLGRSYRWEEIEGLLALLSKLSSDNISFDILVGIPGQTVETLAFTVDRLMVFSPKHISAYLLMVEEGTALHQMVRRGEVSMPEDEVSLELYQYLRERLEREGFSRYEISNFALPGYESRHNLKYWNYEEYLGVGVSAWSFVGGERFGNTKSIKIYVESLRRNRIPQVAGENLSSKRKRFERGMLALRLRRGFPEDELPYDFKERFSSYLLLDDGRVALNDEGMRVYNDIVATLAP